MAQLTLQAATLRLSAGGLVQSRRVQRLRNLLEPGRSELVALGAQQTACLLGQPVDGGPLGNHRAPQRFRPGALGHEVGLRLL